MAVWEFTVYSTKDLEKAIKLYKALEKLGLCFVDEDALREMQAEVEERREI